MEDLGHEMPQGSSGYRAEGKFLREEARPSPALSWVTSKPCRSIQLSWSVLEGIQLSPCQQPHGNVEAEDHLLLVLLLFLLFLFKTATTEDPASHLPDIFSKTLCHAIRICAAIEDSVNEVPFPKGLGREVGAKQRERGRLSSPVVSVGS